MKKVNYYITFSGLDNQQRRTPIREYRFKSMPVDLEIEISNIIRQQKMQNEVLIDYTVYMAHRNGTIKVI